MNTSTSTRTRLAALAVFAIATPWATAAFNVDTTQREESRNFFNTVYYASENVPIQWTGNTATGNAGTTAAAFKDAVALRINFLRALVGVPSIITLNATYSAKNQQAALMMSANNALSHTPPTSWLFYTADGAEAAGNSNLYLGEYGPDAATGYIEDAGSSNGAVGHRRWMLHPQTQQMGTGDLPPSGSYASANTIWVFDGHTYDTRPATRDGFVAWPPKGYVPYPLVWARWSLAYPNANFSAATVTMRVNGTNLPVNILPIATGYGENTLVWVPNGLNDSQHYDWPRPSADTTYSIIVSNVTGTGVPSSFSYTVTIFDPQQPGPDTVLPSITGPTNTVVGATPHYTFNTVTKATGYQWAISQRSAYTLVEGAESGLANMTANIPDGSSLIASDIQYAGSYSFHLTMPGFTNENITLTRAIVPGPSSQLQFQSRLTWATASQTAKAQISTDGRSWTDLYTQAGSGSSGESSFNLRTVSLAAYSGRAITLRFAYERSSGSAYTQTGSGFGWYIDDISVTGANELGATTTNTTSATSFDLTSLAAGNYALRARAQVYDNYYLEWGPVLPLTVTGAAWNWVADQLRARPDGKQHLLWRHLSGGAPDGQVALWTLDSNGVYQASQALGPISGWTAVDLVVSGNDNTPHLVWTHTNGAVSIWNFNASGAFASAQTFGPYSGWTYNTMAISAYDNQQYLLWQRTDGAASLWRLTGNSVYQSAQTMGPYTSWSAGQLLSVSPLNGKARLAWTKSDGTVSLWRFSNTGAYEAASTFGPFSGWTLADLKTGPADNKVRLLWQSATGAASVWRLNTSDVYESAQTYGPVTGWTCFSLPMRPDNKMLLHWQTAGASAASLWRLSSAEGFEAANTFGPYSGWVLQDGSGGGANRAHLLWLYTNGAVALWRIGPTGALEINTNFGPY